MVAAALGAGLVLLRPWRWAPRPTSLLRWLLPVGMEMLARAPLKAPVSTQT